MRRLESQQIESLTGERSACYEVILWGVTEPELFELDNLSDEGFSDFVVEVRELWTSICTKQPNSRQISRLEVSSHGMAQRLYHYMTETLYCL